MKYFVGDIQWLGPPMESPAIHLPPAELDEEEFYDEMFDAIQEIRKQSQPPKEDIYTRMRVLLDQGHAVIIGNKTFEIKNPA